MEDVAVYGYITPLKVKIVLALALSDSVVRDSEVIMVCDVLLPTNNRLIQTGIDIQSLPHGVLFVPLEPFPETGQHCRQHCKSICVSSCGQY
jgi:hypothetical protein